MKNEQLNNLAVQAQNGNSLAYESILAHFLPYVYKMSEQNWYKMSNETSFEHDCLKRLDAAIEKYDITKGNFRTQVLWRFRQALYLAVTRLKEKRRGYEVSSLDFGESDEQYETYEVEDELALIDDGILVNEKIALLAEGDSRKLAILNSWKNGCFNDSSTSVSLAKHFGGNSESHRKFINRFRTTCQKALA